MGTDLDLAPAAAPSAIGRCHLRRLGPGLGLAGVAGLVAVAAARSAPVVGAPVLGIAAGMLLAPVARRRGWAVAPGARAAARYLLPAAIVLAGAGLSLATVVRTGVGSLPVLAGTLAACFVVAGLAGRVLGVPGDLRLLIASGTGICGASAIGAVAPVIAASEAAVGYAMSTIVMFNVLAVLLFPVVGHLCGLDAHAFGLWAGTAINDTSSVVAAGYAYSGAAGDYAVAVKLTRALMIVPLVLGLAGLRRRSAGDAPTRPPLSRLVPAFIPLFLLAATVNTLGGIPRAARGGLGLAATGALTVAMTGIGLGVSLADLRRSGIRPLLFGGLLSLTVAGTGLAAQAFVP